MRCESDETSEHPGRIEKDRVCSLDIDFHKLDVSHAELRAGLRTANLHLSPFACHIFTLQLRIILARARHYPRRHPWVEDDDGAALRLLA